MRSYKVIDEYHLNKNLNGNRDPNSIHHDKKAAELFLKELYPNKNLKGKIVPGALEIAIAEAIFIKKIGERANQINVKFNSIFNICRKELIFYEINREGKDYNIKLYRSFSPNIFSYSLNSFLGPIIDKTKNEEVSSIAFSSSDTEREAKELDGEFTLRKIALREEDLKDYLDSGGIDLATYKQVYGNTASPGFLAYFIPTLVQTLGEERGLYRSQTLKIDKAIEMDKDIDVHIKKRKKFDSYLFSEYFFFGGDMMAEGKTKVVNLKRW